MPMFRILATVADAWPLSLLAPVAAAPAALDCKVWDKRRRKGRVEWGSRRERRAGAQRASPGMVCGGKFPPAGAFEHDAAAAAAVLLLLRRGFLCVCVVLKFTEIQ